jgi:hypothetical protein
MGDNPQNISNKSDLAPGEVRFSGGIKRANVIFDLAKFIAAGALIVLICGPLIISGIFLSGGLISEDSTQQIPNPPQISAASVQSSKPLQLAQSPLTNLISRTPQFAAFVQCDENSSREAPKQAIIFVYSNLRIVRVPPGVIPDQDKSRAKYLDFTSSRSINVEQKDSAHDVFILKGDADLKVGDLKDENTLRALLKAKYGNVTHVDFAFSHSPGSLRFRKTTKTVYITEGNLQDIDLPTQYDRSDLESQIFDIGYSEDVVEKRYEAEIATRNKQFKKDYEPIKIELEKEKAIYE